MMKENIERLRALAEKQTATEDRNFLLHIAMKLEDYGMQTARHKQTFAFIHSLAERISEHCK